MCRHLPPLLLLMAAAVAGPASAQAGHAHQHGVVALEIVVEAQSLSLRLEAPQDSLLGHERRPRNAAEKQAAAAALQRLQAGASLIGLPAELGCQLASAEIEAPLLQDGPASADGHAEVAVRYRFQCQRTTGLRSLQLGGLLDAFPRIQQLSAQIASPGGQHQAQLRRPARALAWGR